MTSLRTSLQASLGFAALVGVAASPALGAGGANPGSAVAIPALPFADTGDTTGGTDDWDEVCPFDGSTSPDHWYSYTPGADESVDIALCESAYDTKVYILDSGFTQIACVDDSCSSSGGGGFRSSIANAALASGELYYIVIDGYLGASGVYDVTMNLSPPPPPCIITECVGTPEGEPCDDSGAPDTVNGGCNNTPAVFSSVACGETNCGTAWGFGGTRDTDWFEVTGIVGTELVTMTVTAEAALKIFTLTGISNGVCGAVGVDENRTLEPCVEGSIATSYAGGDAYLWVGHSDFDTLPCGGESPGNDYVMTVTCYSPFPTCCELGDANEDGDVGFADLIIVLDNWGECPQ